MRRFKLRYTAFLLALIMGAGVDWYVRREGARGNGCWGCMNNYCTAVLIANHPLEGARALWERLTD